MNAFSLFLSRREALTYRAVSFQANCWAFLLPGQKQSVDSSLKMVTSSRESLPAWRWGDRALVSPWWLSVEREMSDEWPRWLEVEEELEAVERCPANGAFMVIGWSCPFCSNIPTFWCSVVVLLLLLLGDWFCCSWLFVVSVSSASGGSGTRWKRFSPIALMMIDGGLLVDWLLSEEDMPSCNWLTESEVPLLFDGALESAVLPLGPPMASDGSETKAIVQLDRFKRRRTVISLII